MADRFVRRLGGMGIATLFLIFGVVQPAGADDGPESFVNPPQLGAMGFAFLPNGNAAKNRVFMYGGLANQSGGLSVDTTYKWNWPNHAWEGVLTDSLPGLDELGRSSTRMALYDSMSRLFLFGGQYCHPGCSLSNTKTYYFDGAAWTDCLNCDASAGGVPDQRTSEGLAFGGKYPSTNRQSLMLYGGNAGVGLGETGSLSPSAPQNDTWFLDGTALTNLAWFKCTNLTWCPTNTPPSRQTPGMAYDANTANMVVFGGSDTTGALGDTWLYKRTITTPYWVQCGVGTDCQQPAIIDPQCDQPLDPPCPRFGHRMVYYDNTLGTKLIFLFGAGKPLQLNDVWFFTGSDPTHGNWERCDTDGEGCDPLSTEFPHSRCCIGLAFDSSQHKILLYGGQHDDAPLAYADTWSWTYGSSGGWVCESELAAVSTPCTRP